MKANEFFHNITFFSQNELKSFEKFLMSPLFNNEVSRLKVFRIIKRNMRLVISKKYPKLKLYIKEQTGLKENTISKILSYLNNDYMNYIKYQGALRNEFYMDYFKCDYLMYKGNYSILLKEINDLKRNLNKIENFDHNYFYKMSEINIAELSSFIYNEKLIDPKNKKEVKLSYIYDSTKNISIYTIARVVINYVNFITYLFPKSLNKHTFPVNPNDYFHIMDINTFKSFSPLQKITINMFHKLYKLYNDLNVDEYYDDFKEYLSENYKLYNHEFHRVLLILLLNYCHIRVRYNDPSKYFQVEALSLQYEFINGEYYKNDRTDFLHSVAYRNYIVNAVIYNQREKLIEFVEKQTSKLHQSDRVMMRAFGLANYHYLMDNYDLAIRYVQKIKKPKEIIKYDLWNLRIKSNYKLGHLPEIESILHNYLENLKRDTFITNEEEKRYKNMVFCMRKIVLATYDYEKKKDLTPFEEVLKYTHTEELLSLKSWLREITTDFIMKHKTDIRTRSMR